ncbi:hypothetical protein H0R92_05155 [Treponema sp. OMZ 840]|uniref:hypothetical protein n=1 Tax=Treponema sp. OMZ 840 TaxID=244313 RepID=UPI003D93B808
MGGFFKSKKYWLFYFLVQLPLAVFMLVGIDVCHSCRPEEKPPVYIEPQPGVYELCNFNEGTPVGQIIITEPGSDDFCFRCSVLGRDMTVFDIVKEKDVFFNSFVCEDIEFEQAEIKDEKIWYGRFNDSYIVIAQIANNKIRSLPQNINIRKNTGYVLAVLNSDLFLYVKKGKTSFNISNLLLIRRYESRYTGLFEQKK